VNLSVIILQEFTAAANTRSNDSQAAYRSLLGFKEITGYPFGQAHLNVRLGVVRRPYAFDKFGFWTAREDTHPLYV
jgi:hypothetical protein